jgi:uncharacterized coiled-coil protein SlyX
MDQRIEQLEFKVAFLEQANAELSGEVYRQHHELEALRAQIMALAGRLEAAQSQATEYVPGQETPPHY